MAVRTKRLAQGTRAAGTDAVVYTCPAGETAILKDIRFWNNTTGSVRSLVYVDSGPALCLILDVTAPAGEARGLAVWVVLAPGDTLRVASLSGQTNFRLSGTELSGVAS